MNKSKNQAVDQNVEVSPSRVNIFSGGDFEREQSYSRAVMVGNQVLVSGTTGFDYATDELVESAEGQMRQLLRNLEAAMNQVDGTLADVVRTRIYISDPDQYEPVMQVFAEAFRGINPACTTVQAGLFDKRIFVEMDTDAILNANS